MLRKKSRLIYILYVLLGIGILPLLWFAFHAPIAHHHDEEKSPSLDPFLTMKNIVLHEAIKNSKYTITLEADESSLSDAAGNIVSSHMRCSIQSHQKAFAFLQAQQSIIDRSNKMLMLKGNVNGNLKELSLCGKDVVYNFSQNNITTQQAMQYKHPQFTACAQQSYIDLEKEEIIMNGGVVSELLCCSTTHNSSN